MKYQIRKINPNEIRPAFDLALHVFMEFEGPDYETEGIENFKADIEWKIANSENYLSGLWLMLVAVTDDNIIGMFESREAGRISMAFIESEYHRQGIATAMMQQMVCELKLMGYDKITVKSSPYGLPFYLNFGFIPTDTVQHKRGSVFTPMSYTPGEIWDVLDESGNKTGRFHERGRKMNPGDYHLVVHVWKYNSKGEWLIDKRSLNRGTSIDGKWETTGGSALAGDNSLTAALRETKEELGIDLDPYKGFLLCRIPRHADDGHTWFQDVWVFEWNGSLDEIRFQEEETCDVMWADADKIQKMMLSGEFLDEWFYPYFNEMVAKIGVNF